MNDVRRPPAFQLIAGHPALDFVNTLDWRFRESGPEELLPRFDDLLRFAGQAGLLTEKQVRQFLRSMDGRAGALLLERCVELREAAAEVFYAGLAGREPAAAPLRVLERNFHAARLHQELCWRESRLEWDWQREERAAAELPLWLLSLSVSGLMLSDAMRRVRACGNPECLWLFLDTSKNHTRRWCDMKVCGNRMKARRFKAQHRAQALS